MGARTKLLLSSMKRIDLKQQYMTHDRVPMRRPGLYSV